MARQALDAGLLDEINVSIAPVVLGAGVRLFDGIDPHALEQVRVIASDGVTHVRYRVTR